VAGDVTRRGDWQRAAAGSELVIHTAAIVSMRQDPDSIWRVNVLGTRNALDAARDGGARRFLHISSVTAFSFDFPRDVTEDHPVRTNGVPYVDTKVASEQVVLQAHAAGEVACTVVRPGDVYGPGARTWTVLPVEELRRGPLLLPAMGRGVFSPVYLDDVVDGIAAAATSAAGEGQVFTISGGVGVSTADFFGHYARLTGKPIVRVPTALARTLAAGAGGVARLSGAESELNAAVAAYLARTGTYSIAKARRMLGFEPAVDLAEGMRRTTEWLRREGLVPSAAA
jgi:nucleoside-diphosphate-sugar epimerase